MKKVLVTGASGGLGQVVVRQLKRSGDFSVVTISRTAGVNSDFQLDVCDRDEVFKVVISVQPDFIFHLSASFSNEFSEAYSTNVEATRHFLDASELLKDRPRIVLIGTAAEYGIVSPEENPVPETRALKPVSIYGLTKAWQTQLGLLFAARGADVMVARIFNINGPHISNRLFIGRVQEQIKEVLAHKKSTVDVGPLSAIRDYINIDDAADQILAIAKKGLSGKVYNVASGKPIQMRELLKHCLKECNLDVSIINEAPENSSRTGYDVPEIFADVSNVRQLMNFSK